MSERKIEVDDIGGRDQLLKADEGSVAGFGCREGVSVMLLNLHAEGLGALYYFLGQVRRGKDLQGRGTNMSYPTHSKDTEKPSAGMMS